MTLNLKRPLHKHLVKLQKLALLSLIGYQSNGNKILKPKSLMFGRQKQVNPKDYFAFALA